jgi:S-adenosyl methyltransferase
MSGDKEPAAGAERPGASVPAGDRLALDTSVAHSARVHDYWLGGKNNFAADRAAGDAVMEAYPGIVMSVRANRAFLARVVRFLTAEAGIRQFLDIGTGIPASNNTHEVAQSVAPECRVVYVDHDPVVLAHARALVTSSPEGAADYIDADLRDPSKILHEAGRTLDLHRPVAVMLIAIMHLIVDADDPYGIVGRLMAAVPAGSYLALSQVASDIESEQMAEAARRYNRLARETQRHRSHAEVARFFDGLDLVEPGLVPVQEWRPGPETGAGTRSAMWGGVGRKR